MAVYLVPIEASIWSRNNARDDPSYKVASAKVRAANKMEAGMLV